MKTGLVTTFDFLLSPLFPPLAMPSLTRLKTLARTLPPIQRGIFECHLGTNLARIDFGQGILRHHSESHPLLAQIDAAVLAGDGPAHPVWHRVHDFCAQWVEPASLLHAGIHTIWLEFDLDDGAVPAPAPSLFFTLKRKGLVVSEAQAIAETALDLLLGESARSRWQAGVRRCFDACRDVARIHQVGVMLARHPQVVRFCVAALPPGQIVPYLRQVGWQGPAAKLESLAAWLLGLVDCIDMVDLDVVGGQVQPQVGLECLFHRQPPREPRWAAFFDALVARGLSAPAWRDAVLAWPGYSNPVSGPLPSLPDRLVLLNRRVSHVKLVYQPSHPLQAKAYLWFNRVEFALLPSQPEADDRSAAIEDGS
ncbi:MAG: hypothetical protein PVF47_18980 [Anaerolineae bacterium]|jgi:hypothetical protein